MPLAGESSVVYDNAKDVVIQVSSNWFRTYYGTNIVVDAAHGVSSYSAVYPNGLHPHVEYQSGGALGYIGVDGVKCRLLSGFVAPGE